MAVEPAFTLLCYQPLPQTPYRDGTTYVIFEPLDFIARLAALVPKPRLNLTRFHGGFAPNSKHRARVTPAKRGRGGQHARTADRGKIRGQFTYLGTHNQTSKRRLSR